MTSYQSLNAYTPNIATDLFPLCLHPAIGVVDRELCRNDQYTIPIDKFHHRPFRSVWSRPRRPRVISVADYVDAIRYCLGGCREPDYLAYSAVDQATLDQILWRGRWIRGRLGQRDGSYLDEHHLCADLHSSRIVKRSYGTRRRTDVTLSWIALGTTSRSSSRSMFSCVTLSPLESIPAYSDAS